MLNLADKPAAEPNSEAMLIAKAQQGDQDAFDSIYVAYRGYVISQCRRLGCKPELAEDLTQDVFFHLWRKITQFKGQSAFKTWLHRVTVNVVFGYFRKNKRDSNLQVKISSPTEDDFDLADWAAVPSSQEDRILISEIFSSLPSHDRMIVRLFTAGYKHDEIAQLMGLTTATSKSQLFRARMKIQKSSPLFRQKPAHQTA